MLQALIKYKYTYITLQGKKWVNNFIALGRFEGFQKKFVTPYIHCLVYHAPQQIQENGNLMMFSGQGNILPHVNTEDTLYRTYHPQVLKRTMMMPPH